MSDTGKPRKSSKSGKQKGAGPSSDQTTFAAPPNPVALDVGNWSSMLPPSALNSPESHTTPKVPIPRLRRESDANSANASGGDKNRVPHACEPCRHKKTKCSGDRPSCKHCEDFGLDCTYGDGKRDKTKKQIGSMAGRLEEYERLLKELSLGVDEHYQARIHEVLERGGPPADEKAVFDDGLQQSSPYGRPKDALYDPHGEDDVSATVGSTESLDKIREDYNKTDATRSTGYHGKNSELTWIQRLKKQTSHDLNDSDDGEEAQDERPSPDGDQYQTSFIGSEVNPVSESTYHCDDLPVLISEGIDPFESPPKDVSDALFHNYLGTIHPVFPIIGRSYFIEQYQRHITQRSGAHHWLAILNVIFAISAKYAHLTRAEWRGNETDHLVYFTRARMLGFNADSILGHAEMQRIQITGLMAFYLMATSQINRSWAMSGIAIRQATAMGLNLRNDAKNVQDSSKEVRYRMWWALSSLERELAVMTGRLPSFLEADCTAPVPLEEDPLSTQHAAIQLTRRWVSQESRPNEHDSASSPSSSNSRRKSSQGNSFSPLTQSSPQEPTPNVAPPSTAFYFFHRTKLSVFTSEVLTRLYRTTAMNASWSQTQANMLDLAVELEHWRADLPAVFDFSRQQHDNQWLCQRTGLGFFYYSTMIIINRPSLCRVDRKIPNESGKARDINRSTAMRCVHAAIDMLKLMPDEPNPIGLYKVSPWWCLVHHLMQASTVLMLELAFRADHMPTEVEEIFESAKKVVIWLRAMSEYDIAAGRAWRMCDEMLRRVAPKVGKSGHEVPNPGVSTETMLDLGHMQDMTFTGSEVYTTSSLPEPPMLSPYDQWPTSSATIDPFESMFPTLREMDAMGFPEHAIDGNPSNSIHGW